MADYDLRDEEQVKQYLKDIETEYSFQCLSEKEPDGCHRLADFMESVKQNEKMGARLFKMNCDDNKYGHSCFKYAGMRMLGKGVDKDPLEGISYFEKACDLDFPRACSAAGMVHLEGQGVQPNPEKGLTFLSRACEKDRAESCAVLGTGYLVAKYGLTKDTHRAQLLLAKGCDLGSLQACVNLSRMYRIGDGVQKNGPLAEKYKQSAIKIKQSQDGGEPGITLGRS